jgi:FdhD protein
MLEPAENKKIVKTPIFSYRDGRFTVTEDFVVREVPVTVHLNGKEFVTLVCSPVELKELAVGFLYSEGVLRQQESLKSIVINEEEGLIWVETAGEPAPRETLLKRFVTSTSTSGRVRASFYSAKNTGGIPRIDSGLRVTTQEILGLASRLEQLSGVFKITGGTHSAALCTHDSVVYFYEDIGRHNAVDKMFGRCFLDGVTFDDKFLVFSGRISSEILIKVAKMGMPMIVSRSAPTELAISMAEHLNITVVGFVREGRLSVYAHRERIAD